MAESHLSNEIERINLTACELNPKTSHTNNHNSNNGQASGVASAGSRQSQRTYNNYSNKNSNYRGTKPLGSQRVTSDQNSNQTTDSNNYRNVG